MSSTSIRGTDGEQASPSQRPRSLPQWLDVFLSEELRRGPLEELGRARVVAGAACIVILCDGLLGIQMWLAGLSRTYVTVATVALFAYAATLPVLRKSSSARPAALLLCGAISLGIMVLASYERDSYLSTHGAGMLVTILAVYLLGPRLGLVILVPMILFTGVILPLSLLGGDFTPRPLSVGHYWIMHAMAAFVMVAGWVVGWLYSAARDATHAALERDIKARKEAEAKLSELHRTLLEVSRQAGMAEIATGVLHNVGNTLNSVNVSAGLVTERLRKSRIARLVQATQLLSEHSADLGTFFTTHPQGPRLPAYLCALSTQLAEEHEALMAEMRELGESVEHIKSVVSMQQQHARFIGVVEQVSVPQLINDALRLHAVSFERTGIEVRCELAEVPPILVDRHKLLQILLNLVTNARHALMESSTPDKRLTLRVGLGAEGRTLRIEVADNGVGIAPEHLPRLFTQGFTTKKTGHGFGLHMSALAAEELKGRLSGTSAGPGQGATFIIELPVQTEDTLSSTAGRS
jgi:signal transduction histidine kinase